ncbi:class I SAM-dependent methyltransferase [Nocardia sp. BMG111209]|uniref:class I SAM-dependent methyltransferase n=1 Tax=Nocardia sp. BMG111209 TaxID=1160137 RepID=UPI000476A23B|nr:class I SAM-dependent methyltransferase [Nocardia sp. BMG111209]
MTEHHPNSVTHERQDYLPAAGLHSLLPAYDLLSRALGAPALHARLVDQADLAPGQRVLEIGCGTGNLTIRAKREQPGAEVIGSDPDPRALVRAQRKAKGLSGIRFEQAYAQDLPYPDESFDRMLSSLMLHHLDTDIRTATAAEALRVLRPGGRLHVVDVGGHLKESDGRLGRMMLNNPHAVRNLGDGIPDLLRAAGFECREVASQPHRVIGRLTYYQATRPER